MEEIRKYLVEKKEEQANKLIEYGFTSMLTVLLPNEKKFELKKKNEEAKKNYNLLIHLLAQLDNPHEQKEQKETTMVNEFNRLLNELKAEAQRNELTKDIQTDVAKHIKKLIKINYSHDLMKLSYQAYLRSQNA